MAATGTAAAPVPDCGAPGDGMPQSLGATGDTGSCTRVRLVADMPGPDMLPTSKLGPWTTASWRLMLGRPPATCPRNQHAAATRIRGLVSNKPGAW